MSRQVRCHIHHIYRRCPACEGTRKPTGLPTTWVVPPGIAEWLREAATVFARLGDEGAVAFVEWVSVDLREAA